MSKNSIPRHETLAAEERERQRIAAGLHDDIGQLLGIAKVKLSLALADGATGKAGEAVAEARRLVDQAIREIRSLTFELSSPTLHKRGLEPALRDLAEQARERHGLAFRFATDARPKPISKSTATLLYSIVRELIRNVVKHANARQGALSLARDGDCLRITVDDDGAGFNAAAETAPGSGFGLFSVRQRLEHFGGRLEIDSAPGEGTRVVLTLPLATGAPASGVPPASHGTTSWSGNYEPADPAG